MKKSELKKFAKLIACKGANVQKGQEVIININIEESYFAPLLVEECYKCGAKRVKIDWNYDDITVLKYKYESADTLKEFPKYKEEEWQYKSETLPVLIYIESSAPDALDDIDQAKQMDVRKVIGPKVWKYRKGMEGRYQWCIVSLPGIAWARKLFPGESDKKAQELLWNAIKKTTRLEGDAIKNWTLHDKFLDEKAKWLNSLDIKTLIYKNSIGTDFTIDLIKDTIFCAGKSINTENNVSYLPNMPTEECFISPDKYSANGKVFSSKPLSLMGTVVSDFGFEFKNGKVINVFAKDDKQKEILEKLISLDEGASYLGEVALVPFDSPINQTGLLFFNTLFDENACCHLAVGMGFEEVIKDVEKKTKEEIEAYGINDSIVHTDFMIGTSDLNIKAITRDGKTIQIFENGTWAKEK